MRKKIIAGNWKMNPNVNEALSLINELENKTHNLSLNGKKEIYVFAPYIYLYPFKTILDNSNIKLGAQNCSQFNNGAYTGEISALMLKEMSVNNCIIGHSERRQYFGDCDLVINQKLKKAFENDITPILCCGEKLEDRKNNLHFKVVEKQIIEALIDISKEDIKKTTIAYEPVWAIGTGETATPEQAEEMHVFIRNLVAKIYDEEIANNICMFYGGSVNAKNAKSLFAKENIDGALVGGAFLKAPDFLEIINSI